MDSNYLIWHLNNSNINLNLKVFESPSSMNARVSLTNISHKQLYQHRMTSSYEQHLSTSLCSAAVRVFAQWGRLTQNRYLMLSCLPPNPHRSRGIQLPTRANLDLCHRVRLSWSIDLTAAWAGLNLLMALFLIGLAIMKIMGSRLHAYNTNALIMAASHKMTISDTSHHSQLVLEFLRILVYCAVLSAIYIAAPTGFPPAATTDCRLAQPVTPETVYCPTLAGRRSKLRNLILFDLQLV